VDAGVIGEEERASVHDRSHPGSGGVSTIAGLRAPWLGGTLVA
jgi:hypothetical protein